MRTRNVVVVMASVAVVAACGAPDTMVLDESAIEGPPGKGTPAFASAAAPETCGNGLDDNNDGTVDEGCPCTAGATQRCFAGQKALAGVGACTMGTQTCVGGSGSEVSVRKWGPCVGGGAAVAETCNGIDDDCNGRADDAPQCAPGGDAGAGAPPGAPSGNPPGTPPGPPAGPPCQGTGLIFRSVGNSCIDDGGGSAKDDELQVYCVNNIARFCLSYEACPWRDGVPTSNAVTCSRAGLSSTYFVSARESCGIWEGHSRICCSMTGQVTFTGC